MFNMSSNAPSLADIAAVTDGNRNNGNNGFGEGWWVIIILLALFGGFGGYGGYGAGRGASGGGSGETTIITVPPAGGGCGSMGYGFGEAALQRGFDTQTIIGKLDGLNSGVCGLGYDQLAQMNGINTNIMQTGNAVVQAITNDSINNMQNTNALSTQIANCCCENRQGQADIRYTLATDTCAINTNIHQTGDAIIQSQNQGFQMLNNTINDRFSRLEMQQKDQRIQELEQQLNRCDRNSALQEMSGYIVSSLNPTAKPCYVVQNPNCCSPVPVVVQDNQNACGGRCAC